MTFPCGRTESFARIKAQKLFHAQQFLLSLLLLSIQVGETYLCRLVFFICNNVFRGYEKIYSCGCSSSDLIRKTLILFYPKINQAARLSHDLTVN